MRISDWRSDVCSSELTTDEVTADFANMASGVAAWAQQHNQAYHFINADQLQHIADLEREGKSQQAVTEVTKLLTDHIQAQGSALGVWGQTAKFWTDLMRSEEHTSELQYLMRNT